MKAVLDAHIHSIASVHAYSTITENTRAAAERGLALIAITDHAPGVPDSALMPHFANLHALPKELFGVRLLRGVELNIMDYEGNVDMAVGQYRGLDIRIASLHTVCCKPGSVEQNTSALIGAMRNPLIQIIGHPGDRQYPIDIERVLDAAAETNTVPEINNPRLALPRYECEASIREIAAGCLKRGLPVLMSSDAHFHTHVGVLDHAAAMLAELGFPDALVLNNDVSLFLQAMGLSE